MAGLDMGHLTEQVTTGQCPWVLLQVQQEKVIKYLHEVILEGSQGTF